MKKIIDGKRYDTDTARKIAERSTGGSFRDFSHLEETLYCKRTGEYFLAGEGGPMTKYAKSVGQNTTSGGSAIIPQSIDEAREWAEKHMDADEYEAEFAIQKEPSTPIGANIRKIRESKNLTQKQLADLADTAQSVVAEIERGQQDITTTRLLAFATALSVDPGELLR